MCVCVCVCVCARVCVFLLVLRPQPSILKHPFNIWPNSISVLCISFLSFFLCVIPSFFSPFLSLSLSFSLSLFFSLSHSLSLFLTLSLFLSFSLSLFLSLYLSICLILTLSPSLSGVPCLFKRCKLHRGVQLHNGDPRLWSAKWISHANMHTHVPNVCHSEIYFVWVRNCVCVGGYVFVYVYMHVC